MGAMAGVAVALSCVTAGVAGESKNHGEQSGPAPGCNLAPLATCGSGHLPRLTEKDWSVKDRERFFDRARAGTVAVDSDGRTTRLVEGCKLAGTYTEVAGEPGSGRFWATDRAIFRVDEVSSGCRTATHAVAAFAKTATSFGAILVPLPCPPTRDAEPAPGCVGKGLTGPARVKRGLALRATIPPDRGSEQDVAKLLEIFALMPDHHLGLDSVAQLNQGDCPLDAQGEWVNRGYSFSRRDEDGAWTVTRRTNLESWDVPRITIEGSPYTCASRPVFLQCFPGLFDPAPAGYQCWRPADSHG
jgi:hypothetical protein